ncbi:hypothetical protein [Herbaspirillum sp. CF444]|uniref:hypothetical protein n=1 Tax=Herbaspirillum sp. CF444 TaxID=1144319 RepID=UPI0012F95BFF|nr:hypothetical protein [Herbaspirillum sp. CF444]
MHDRIRHRRQPEVTESSILSTAAVVCRERCNTATNEQQANNEIRGADDETRGRQSIYRVMTSRDGMKMRGKNNEEDDDCPISGKASLVIGQCSMTALRLQNIDDGT